MYTFEVSGEGVNSLAGSTDPLSVLAGWYLLDLRPSPSEIVGIYDTKLNMMEGRVIITIKIKRGHHFITNFVQKHLGHSIAVKEDQQGCCVVAHCNGCGETLQVDKAAIPDFYLPN